MNVQLEEKIGAPSVLPFISVIMPSYNQARFIQVAIESILDQGYPNLELIVIDAGSKDQTHSIVRQYGDRLRFVHAPGSKQSEVMNMGLELARGEIVGYLNADDHYFPKACFSVGGIFKGHPEIDMLYGNFTTIDQEGRRLLTHNEIDFHYPSYLFLGQCISYPTVFFRRAISQKVGRFDTQLDHAMDYDYWLRIARSGQVRHVPLLLAGFRWHPDSKSVVYHKEASQEARGVRGRYYKSSFFDFLFKLLHIDFLWCFYKLRRIIIKALSGKYFFSPPQPWVYLIWKIRLLQ